jgi:hypothetical protein
MYFPRYETLFVKYIYEISVLRERKRWTDAARLMYYLVNIKILTVVF